MGAGDVKLARRARRLARAWAGCLGRVVFADRGRCAGSGSCPRLRLPDAGVREYHLDVSVLAQRRAQAGAGSYAGNAPRSASRVRGPGARRIDGDVMAQVNRSRPTLKSERGAELIEFALIFPLLLLVLLGIVDFGFLFQRYEVLDQRDARRSTDGESAQLHRRRRQAARLRVPDIGRRGDHRVAREHRRRTRWSRSPTSQSTWAQGNSVARPSAFSSPTTTTSCSSGRIIGLMGGSWNSAKTITTAAIMRLELAHRVHRPWIRVIRSDCQVGDRTMNRSTRTFVVVLIAVGVAALASFGVYRAIQQNAGTRSRSPQSSPGCRGARTGDGLTDYQGRRQAGRVAGEQPGGSTGSRRSKRS